MKNFLILIFTFLSFYGLGAQGFTEEEKDILMLQDLRTLGENNKLLNYLSSADNKLVKRSLSALANIGDSGTVKQISYQLLNNPDSQVRQYAAFSLGQIPCNKSKEYLTEALNKEKENNVLMTIMSALGKAGDESSLGLVADYSANNDSVKNSIALAIARFAIRNIKNEKAVNTLNNFISGGIVPSYYSTFAYAYNRIRNKELLSPLREILLNFTLSNDYTTRMWGFSALGYIADEKDIPYVFDKLEKDDSWQVKVNILNSLLFYKKANPILVEQMPLQNLFNACDDVNPNVRVTALRVISSLFSDVTMKKDVYDNIRNRLEWYFPPDKAVEWFDKAEAILAYGTIFKDDVKTELFTKFSETENSDLLPYIIRSFKSFKNAMVYKELTDSIRSFVIKYNREHNQKSGEMVQDRNLSNIYEAYVETIAELKDKVDEENQNLIRLILSEFTGSKVPPIVDICFNALNSPIYSKYKDETEKILLMDYKELEYPKDKEVMILFINQFGLMKNRDAVALLEKNLKSVNYDLCKVSANALKNITGKDYTFKTKSNSDFDWEFINALSKFKYAIIKTNLGNIKIELLPDVAPFSVQNFVKLSRKGFYNGTTFHRVVPNFVIQGGDPLNSGWGGPEFSIRSEFSELAYTRGAFGMASDGKDTEGSQFFIMHAPHYHLDGRYTLFGYVKEGMDVVDKIYLEDNVETITFSEN